MDGRTALLLLGVAVAACASSPPAGGGAPGPENGEPLSIERAFLEGLGAARRGEFSAAVSPLARVAEACAETETGDHARLALLGVLTDPRNPERDLARARRIAERWLASPSAASWLEPLVEALYLVTLDLGGASADAPGPGRLWAGAGSAWNRSAATWKPVATAPEDGCESAPPPLTAREPRLPALPGRPLQDALSESERRRAQLVELAERLETRVAELEAELERIRKTLEP